MIYFKSVLFGCAGAIAAAVAWILAAFVLPIVAPMLLSRFAGKGGSSGAFMSSNSVLVAALVGFAAGFFWRFRR